MISGLSVLAENGSTIDFALPFGSDGYIIESITGLGPVPVTHVSTSYGQLDGDRHQHSRRGKRTITITIILDKSYYGKSVEDRRYYLDTFFVPKQELTLMFDEDRLGQVMIKGRVEDIDAPIFTRDPYYQVSIVCDSPDFSSSITMEHSIDLATTVIGDSTEGEVAIEYPGTVATGFVLEMTSWGGSSSANTIIRNRTGDGVSQNIQIAGSIAAGRRLRISTVERDKFAQYITSTGVVQPGLASLSNDSRWIQIMPGINTFRISTSAPAGKVAEITYNVLYGGL